MIIYWNWAVDCKIIDENQQQQNTPAIRIIVVAY